MMSQIFAAAPSMPLSEYATLVSNLEVREYLNAALVALNLIIVVMTGRHLLTVFRSLGWEWRKYPGAMMVACLWWIFTTDFVRACLAWHLLHSQNNGRNATFMNPLDPAITWAYIVAGVVATLATLRLVYAMSPNTWGHRGWVTALSATALTVTVLAFLVD